MNKRELVEAVAEATGLSRSAAGKAVEAALEVVATATVPGFGTFEARERAFRAGKALRDRVN